MNLYKVHLTILLMVMSCSRMMAQDASRLTHDVEASIEASATVSSGEFAPLWLSSNRQGIVSPYGKSSFERVGVFRSTTADSTRQWRIGYGLDLTLNQNAQSTFFIHQAYAQIDYKKLSITIGSKEREIDLRNNELTSGGLSQGINAQPIPELLLEVGYFDVPWTNKWVNMRARLGYGALLDGAWQKQWIGDPSVMKYSSNMLYHEKAAYLRFGKKTSKIPLVFEAGLQMYCMFGGTHYNVSGRGHYETTTLRHSEDAASFLHALLPFGSHDVTDGTSPNAEGNHLGSYNMALEWSGKDWSVRGYFERFFEDHSQMFLEYGLYDHLVGVEISAPENRYVKNIVIEHISTKDQSGPVFHDKSSSIPMQISGKDDYYNHNIHVGWQYYGMTIGNPLLTSPIYNSNHTFYFYNNRVEAWHFGLQGTPSKQLDWRMLLTFVNNLGSYSTGIDAFRQTHFLCEATYSPEWMSGWTGKVAFAFTGGQSQLLGVSTGVQITLRKEVKL